MEALEELKKKVWWDYLGEDLQNLFLTSQFLYKVTEDWEKNPLNGHKFHDFSFVVFPAAKAYEGFLKKLFLEMDFITEEDYYGKRFRIGKALNPSLEKELRHEGVYDKLVNYCGGKDLADSLWETWKQSRNLIFHWFPNEKNTITLLEAGDRLAMISNAIDRCFRECKIQ